jgi:two-component system chemotaxis sensor kinase CheA
MGEESIVDIFRAESAEILQRIETGLVSLEEKADPETINDLFRGFHTLKGSSGMAGFDHVSQLTHAVESRLDQIRSGVASASEAFIDLLLDCVDWTRTTVAQNGEPAEGKASLMRRLADDTILLPSRVLENADRYFRIRMKFRNDIFLCGIDPLMVVEDLHLLGEFVELKCDRSAIEPLSKMDPEVCSLSWTVVLKAQCTMNDIESVFVFVKDDNDITIDDVTAGYSAEAAAASGEIKLGEILVKRGVLTPDELSTVLEEQSVKNEKIGDIVVKRGLASAQEVSGALKEQDRARKDIDSGTVRVETAKLDALMNLLGEIVIGQSSLARIAGQIEDERGELLRNALYALDRTTREFQEHIMTIRMLPIGPTFSQFKRFVRDAAKGAGKDILLEINGAETELDKTVLEQISDPLKHMIRNAIDHGIESSADRVAAGKPAEGHIVLSAYHQEGHVYIEIRDDGKGIDVEKVKEKALAKGLLSASEDLSEDTILSVIFLPGFSTADKVTDLSGRGVGMDVVKNNISALRGSIDVRTTKGKGSVFKIKLPLTMAIIEGMLCRVGNNTYIVPLLSIVESIQPKKEDVHTLEGKGEMVFVRGEYLSLVRSYDYFGVKPEYTDPWKALLIIVESGGEKLALMIDDLIGQQQVVIKSLDSFITTERAISGAAIMGDGSVALIVDIHGMLNNIARN